MAHRKCSAKNCTQWRCTTMLGKTNWSTNSRMLGLAKVLAPSMILSMMPASSSQIRCILSGLCFFWSSFVIAMFNTVVIYFDNKPNIFLQCDIKKLERVSSLMQIKYKLIKTIKNGQLVRCASKQVNTKASRALGESKKIGHCAGYSRSQPFVFEHLCGFGAVGGTRL